MIRHSHPEMRNAYEVVLHPPPFRVLGGQMDKDGKRWNADVYFETPRGPVHINCKLELPEAVSKLREMIGHRLIKDAAINAVAAEMGYEIAQDEFGLHPEAREDYAEVWGNASSRGHYDESGNWLDDGISALSSAVPGVSEASKALSKASSYLGGASSMLGGLTAKALGGLGNIPGLSSIPGFSSLMGGAARATGGIAGTFGRIAQAAMDPRKALSDPRAFLQGAATDIAKAARIGASSALGALPPAMRNIALGPLRQVASASSQMGLDRALNQAVNLLGSTYIPGTQIPIAALNPTAAGLIFAAKVIGPERSANLMSNAANDLTQMLMSAGELPRFGAGLIKLTARNIGKTRAQDVNFADEVGIPTLRVDPGMQPAARNLIKILRGAYVGDAQSLRAFTALRDKAATGDKTAVSVWNLAANISQTAWALQRGAGRSMSISAGDGFGEGYGIAGYSRPSNPMDLSLLSERTLVSRSLFHNHVLHAKDFDHAQSL